MADVVWWTREQVAAQLGYAVSSIKTRVHYLFEPQDRVQRDGLWYYRPEAALRLRSRLRVVRQTRRQRGGETLRQRMQSDALLRERKRLAIQERTRAYWLAKVQRKREALCQD